MYSEKLWKCMVLKLAIIIKTEKIIENALMWNNLSELKKVNNLTRVGLIIFIVPCSCRWPSRTLILNIWPGSWCEHQGGLLKDWCHRFLFGKMFKSKFFFGEVETFSKYVSHIMLADLRKWNEKIWFYLSFGLVGRAYECRYTRLRQICHVIRRFLR